MSKQKLSKQERVKRENGLVEAIVAGLVATVEGVAKIWAFKARDLREGLSKTAIKRAERKAHKLADERPPGFVRAMECLDTVDQIARKYGLSKRNQELFWQAVAEFSMFQLAAMGGPFYEAAVEFGLVPSNKGPRVQVARPPTPGCNCNNCRPRRAEELN